MDRVWLRLLALLGAPDCRRSPGSEPKGQESFPPAEGVGELECDYGEWKYYAFPASVFLALLIFITVSYFFYSKYQNCRQLCGCRDSYGVLEGDSFDTPWEPNLLEHPEPCSICVTPPQNISGRSACPSKAWDQVREEDIRLPFAPKDLGENIGQDSNFQTFQKNFGPGSLSESLGARADLGSSSDYLFTIEDLD